MKILVALPLLLVFSSMGEANKVIGDTDVDVLAFQVGSIAISKYIYERELEKSFNSTANLNDSTVDSWINNWADRIRITNRALSKGFEKNPTVLNTVDIINRHSIIHGKESPFYRHVIDPLIYDSSQQSDSYSEHTKKKNRITMLNSITKDIVHGIQLNINEDIAKTTLNWFLKENNIYAGGKEIEPSDEWLYEFEGFGISGRVSETAFREEYNSKIFKRHPIDLDTLRYEILSILSDKVLLNNARKLKLHLDQRYLAEYENFKNNVIHNIYIDRPLKAENAHQEKELIDYYKTNIDQYKSPESVTAWEVSSSSAKPLGLMKRKIREMLNKSIRIEEIFDSLDKENLNIKVHTIDKKSDLFADKIQDQLFENEAGWCSKISFNAGSYTILIKRSNVNFGIRPFEEVRESVLLDFLKTRKKARMKQEIELLRKEFPLIKGPYLEKQKEN